VIEVTIAELKRMIEEYRPKTARTEFGEKLVSGLYVRWSTTPERDCQVGRSTNHATGQTELGLSVNELALHQTWHGMDTGRTLRDRVMEYSFLPGRPWVVEGYRLEDNALMRGSDNEPLLLYPKPIAWIVTD